uniref:LysM peptidoglycan-binding domain-containing protein n=1 Tax=Pseudonocardia sp. CA-138482 TaxID=3240023 RepID=UPI003F497557
MGGYRGRHRAPSRQALNLARIAVGGLALAEITGGLGVVPAWASPVLARHHDHRGGAHHAKSAPKAAPPAPAQRVAVAAPAPPPPDPAPQPAPAAPPADDLFSHYTVVPGDTLTHIAAAYQIPWEALWAVNSDRVSHPDLIFPGQRLRLPT